MTNYAEQAETGYQEAHPNGYIPGGLDMNDYITDHPNLLAALVPFGTHPYCEAPEECMCEDHVFVDGSRIDAWT